VRRVSLVAHARLPLANVGMCLPTARTCISPQLHLHHHLPIKPCLNRHSAKRFHSPKADAQARNRRSVSFDFRCQEPSEICSSRKTNQCLFSTPLRTQCAEHLQSSGRDDARQLRPSGASRLSCGSCVSSLVLPDEDSNSFVELASDSA
jgi:hypothetical protein